MKRITESSYFDYINICPQTQHANPTDKLRIVLGM